MSWFSKAGIYEKLALYCIDKSPLLVDKHKLKSKDGKIILTDARINHRLDSDNEDTEINSESQAVNELNGFIKYIELEISSSGLTINIEGSELTLHDTGQSSLDVNQITEDLMKSVHLLKNNISSFDYKDYGSSSYSRSFDAETSTDSSTSDLKSDDNISIKKEPLYSDDVLKSEENELEENEDVSPSSSGSLMDSFKNKILDMVLSNFHIKFTDTRIILLDSEMIVDIESFEAKSSGNERYIDIFGVGLQRYDEENVNTTNPMEKSIFVSARSSFAESNIQQSKVDSLKENDFFIYLEEMSIYFMSNNDPSKLIPEEIMISDFSIKYEDTTMDFNSFNIFVKKNIHKYIFKTDELILKITSPNLDVKGYKVELTNIEYGNYIKTRTKNGKLIASDTFEIEKFKVSHKNINLSSKKSKTENKAFSVVFKNNKTNTEKSFGLDFKLAAIELVSKAYRINSGIILKIPVVVGNWQQSKLSADINTLSFSLIESFKNLNILNNFVIVDNIKLNFVDKRLFVDIGDMFGDFCADSLNCFIKTVIDVFYTETFPDHMKYKFETEKDIDMSDIFETNDFFTPENIVENKKQTDSEFYFNSNDSQPKFKLKKRFLKSLIENSHVNSHNEFNNFKQLFRFSSDSQFTLNLRIKSVVFKMHDGFNFKYTKNTIASKLKQQSDSDSESHEVLFNSIYIPKNYKQNAFTNNDYLETQNFNKLPEFSLQRFKDHSGELIIKDFKLTFESVNKVVQSKLKICCQELEVFDRLKQSDFNKFLTSHKTPEIDHSFFKEKRDFITFELETVKPDEHLLATEIRMKLKLEPIKMHVNEEFIDFLMRFFTFKDERFELIDEYPENAFIQKLEIMGINISVDFKSKNTKLQEPEESNESKDTKVRSKFLNTLKSLIVVENCDLKFKHLVMYGIDDFSDISAIIQSRWIMDVVNSQRIALMSGVLPLNSAMNITTALKNLIEQPFVQSSSMDVSRSLQNNLLDLGRVSGNELLKFGVNISHQTQKWLESTESMLLNKNNTIKDSFAEVKSISYTNEGNIIGQKGRKNSLDHYSSNEGLEDEHILRNKTGEKPTNFKEGLNLAFTSLESNLGQAYKTVSNTSKDVQRTNNNKDASKMIINNLGITLLKPLIGATGALNSSFQGLQGELQDDEMNHYLKLYFEDKYKV